MRGKIFYGGTIITMDAQESIVEAVYVEDGFIRAIDTYDALTERYPAAESVDLQGNVMFPGFIDPHVHMDLCSMFSQMQDISGLTYEHTEDVISKMKRVVKETPKGKWVVCFGLDYLLNRDLPQIDRYWLDAITTEHPLALIIQSMHTMYINSLGLKLAGIDRNTKDTRDGHCLKDENGEPLGILTEQGFLVPIGMLWLKDLHKSPELMIREELDKWVKSGVTTLWTAGYTPLYPDHFKLFSSVFNHPECPIRGDYSISFNSIENGMVVLEEQLSQDSPKTKMTGIKSWYDGSPYTGNMLMRENYLENDVMQKRLYIPIDNHGERLFDQEFFYKMLKKYHDMGFQLSIHAQGDQAGHEVIDILERVLTESPRKDHRHRLEHCVFIDQADLERCGRLGITVSFHTNHLYYYGEALSELVLGEERTQRMLLCKTALDNGMRISFHSDAPMYPPNPLQVAANTVTRKTRLGKVIGKEEAITRTQALRGITIDAAWQLLREKEIGSIEVGKRADFTVIKENPYEVPAEHWQDIEIVTTYIDGIDTKTLNYGA